MTTQYTPQPYAPKDRDNHNAGPTIDMVLLSDKTVPNHLKTNGPIPGELYIPGILRPLKGTPIKLFDRETLERDLTEMEQQ
ncbi:hypothetical protein A2642_04935 [Candidatus Nomurabacteria bacterium RIFCSPHIGHO2_01_FULL_39_10]|uniref:Uncharacterized protein n=1 Tax=Candidatus Nomurabacteria bacterium RIFCSPHIGHO2_01_FULL_39_10 TaxID=1801733 RepID=A0A1F6V8I6_9BACT|nr:MAG: hypothetical protein A2642_04935 [Candidatus Nomurabacteria bacterium RIFCSPHIGHO2_01_FULL_39_10]